MKRYLFLLVLPIIMLGCTQKQMTCFKYVNPFVGTDTYGHTYPGALLPFGFVQLSPDTGDKGWNHCSGYHSSDDFIMGFSHTHLSGTGAVEMGDILIMPMIGKPKYEPEIKENSRDGYCSHFSKDTETATPGYYAVNLDKYNIKAELTATQRVGLHQYTFPGSDSVAIIIDLGHGIGDETIESTVSVVNDHTITGFRHSSGFIRDQPLYFCSEFSKPFKEYITYKDGHTGNESKVKGKICKIILKFETAQNEKILVKTGLSTFSEKNAMANILAEMPHWNFNKVVDNAKKSWNKELSKIEITGNDEKEKTTFYTAFYHTMMSPNLFSDVDGSYHGWDGKNHQKGKVNYFTNYSLWDTYRAEHPLLLLLSPEKDVEFINSMLQRYREIGELPINEYGINETFCMIGNHAIPVIVDAYLRGTKGFDANLAYEAVKHSSMNSAFNFKVDWDNYMKYGYLPSDIIKEEAVSRTLESAYDDWCVAQMAKKMGKTEDYKYFSKRAGFYKNLFDPENSLMRGRKTNGAWVSPFDHFKISHTGDAGGDYTEGNAWQYTWQVQQDVNGLIDLMGGDRKFITKLDSLFHLNSNVYGDGFVLDVTGLIGQYAHGNEPCHHVAYLYNFAGAPWKTQEMVNRIKNTLYSDKRDGLCGNDDCGQMSAWYVFGALGFYPVTPGADYFVIGTPSFKQTKLHLPNGKTFVVKADNLSKDNFYIQSAKLNGKTYTKSYIKVDDIRKGGVLEFVMGPEPQKEWGSKAEDRPVSRIE
ncbi:MAG: GH92 family glycosyl hydrolase [Bacteroidota bacterium]|nr:GH92 family glycosyl hydrolase [Bacteroidota bacterium]